jgi:hypothetical protein
MVFRNRKQSVNVSGKNCGSIATPLVKSVACIAAVVGGLWFALGASSNSADSQVKEQHATTEATRQKKKHIEKTRPHRARGRYLVSTESETVFVSNVTQSDTPHVQESEPVQSSQEKVADLLAAGEFVSALQTAVETVDVKQQSQLLMQVADAQMALGEFDSARKTIRRIPDPLVRSRTNGKNTVQKSLAGGGIQADFASLKTLIMSSVDESALWLDEDGEGGTMQEYEAGVRVDPNGLLYRLTREEHNGRLAALGSQARKADLNQDMARTSPLRLVSLTRLEKEIAKRLADGEPVLETMKRLAGLSKIQYVFIYPEEHEIVLGGPAEGWMYTGQGTPVGIESGRPILQLDDFVTVLRTFSPGGNGIFGCLIVPRKEGLKRVDQFVRQSNAAGPLRAGGSRRFAGQLGDLLGLQDVIVQGIPKDSRAARVIVEADYRMKLIGIDKLDAGKDIPSYFDLLTRNFSETPASMNALRWWLTMKYDSILHSPDRNVFEITGSSVQCLSENERITAAGERIHTGQSGLINTLFAQNFSNHYEGLAMRDPVFADLQNVFDLALVAALIRRERADQRLGWDQGVFRADGNFRTALYEPAEELMSVVNHRKYRGKEVVVQVAGGVRADLMRVVKNNKMFREMPRLASVSKRSKAPKLPEGRWWWDAAE